MAIVLMESFDQLATGAGARTTENGWVITDNNASLSTGTGGAPRTGTRFLETRQHVMYRTLGVTYPEIIYSGGYRASTIGAGTILQLRESAANVTHLQMRMTALGKLQLFNGAGAVQFGADAVTPLVGGAWYWIEVRLKIHDTLGEVELRIGGQTEVGAVGLAGPLTGLDTRNGGTGVFDQIYYTARSFNAGDSHDDIVLVDPLAGTPTTFIGDSRVECLFPNGNGNSSQFLGSDGNSVDNYALVDEVPHNSDTDYVESNVIGEKDTYAYPSIALASGTVHAVQIGTVARKSSVGSRKYKPVSRLGATEVDGVEVNLADSYILNQQIQHAKPGGGAWSLADVNAAEFGIKVTA